MQMKRVLTFTIGAGEIGFNGNTLIQEEIHYVPIDWPDEDVENFLTSLKELLISQINEVSRLCPDDQIVVMQMMMAKDLNQVPRNFKPITVGQEAKERMAQGSDKDKWDTSHMPQDQAWGCQLPEFFREIKPLTAHELSFHLSIRASLILASLQD